ncbi:T-complex protein 1 subunit gamma, partial [Coemansia sp. S610]
MLAISAPFLERKIHPVVILRGFQKALEDSQVILRSIAKRVDTGDREQMLSLIKSAIGTKFVSRWNDLMCNLALTAVQTVIRRSDDSEFASIDISAIKAAGSADAEPAKLVAGGDTAAATSATDAATPAAASVPAAAAVASAEASTTSAPDVDVREVDIKRFVRVEKVPGGEIEESRVLDGVMVNKDVVHPKMRRRIENPRIILLDCPLEYKKGESQTNIEITREGDWSRVLEIEEEQIKAMCEKISALKPDLVITEKGVSDLAQHYLVKENITALRRMRKTDNNRIARATGAKIVTSVDELKEQDVGTGCGLFSVEKIGDEYFSFLTECKDPKA